MYYYQKHIGDYRSATAHLDLLHHGVYQYLMETCYMNEQPLPIEVAKVCRLCGARTQEEKEAVQNILDEFFTLTEKGWVNSRVEKEINAYHANSDKNRANGAKGGRPRKNKTQNNPVGFDSVSSGLENDANSKPNQKATINHKPLTINQEPLTSNQYIYTFDIDYVNANLLKSGRKPVDQKYIDQLQPQFELYYANQPMADNKALVKFVQWIMRNQDQPQKQNEQYQTSQQRTASEMDRWRQAEREAFGERDVTPKKSLLIEEVGHA